MRRPSQLNETSGLINLSRKGLFCALSYNCITNVYINKLSHIPKREILKRTKEVQTNPVEGTR